MPKRMIFYTIQSANLIISWYMSLRNEKQIKSSKKKVISCYDSNN